LQALGTIRAVVLLGLASAGLTGCFKTSHLVPKAQAPEAYKTATIEELESGISERDAKLKTLNAQVLITATTGGSKTGKVTEYTSFRGYLFVQKPANMRAIMQLPVIGSRALDMVSDGKTFTLVHATAGHGDVWMQGSDTVTAPSKNGLENLRPNVFLDSLLVPPPRPDEFVALTESERVLRPETTKKAPVEEPDYDLVVLKRRDATSNVMVRERLIHINRLDMLPFQQDIYDAGGQIVTQAQYEQYRSFGDQMFPTLITIWRPQDQYTLKIQITKLTLNQEFDSDQFELTIPDGVAVKKME
jgi:outer membrane lipoprotein-sorting protein